MNPMFAAVSLFFGALIACASLVIWLARRPLQRARRAPLTESNRFSGYTRALASGDAASIKLSALGYVAALFLVSFAAIGVLVSIATAHFLASPEHSQARSSLPQVLLLLLAPAVIDALCLWLAWKFWRHHALLRRGQVTSGIIVGFGVPGHPTRGLIPTLYDFSPQQGLLERGMMIINNYSSGSPLFGVYVGSAVDVVYFQDRPHQNALLKALLWRT